MAYRYKSEDISSLDGRKIFFDANVLIYIYWPVAQNNLEKSYSGMYKALLQNKNPLVINTVVLSEIINSVLRIGLHNYNLSNQSISFKKYRDSPDGKDAQMLIYQIIIDNILTRFEVLDKTFSMQDLSNLLVVDSLDFGDKIIESVCKENNLILFTNDKDFSESDIDILSANNRLL